MQLTSAHISVQASKGGLPPTVEHMSALSHLAVFGMLGVSCGKPLNLENGEPVSPENESIAAANAASSENLFGTVAWLLHRRGKKSCGCSSTPSSEDPQWRCAGLNTIRIGGSVWTSFCRISRSCRLFSGPSCKHGERTTLNSVALGVRQVV